jgi:glycosyltransferase involved in cell wall biosynthesis
MGIRVVVIDDNPHLSWEGRIYPVNATFHRFLSSVLDVRSPDGSAPVAEIVHCVPLRDATSPPATLPVDTRLSVVGTAPFDGIAGYLRHLGGLTRRNHSTLQPVIRTADLVWLKVPASNAALGAWLAGRAGRPRFAYVAGSARDVVRSQARDPLGRAGALITGAVYDLVGRIVAWRGGHRLVVGEGVVDGSGIVTTLIEPGDLRDPAGRSWPAAPGLLRLAWAGRLVASKGLEAILEAVARERRWTLTVLGDGPERGRLEALAGSFGVADRVAWRGHVADRVPYLTALSEADVFVFPSAAEGFPKVVLDALAVGVPVVATAVGGLRELLDADLIEPIATQGGAAVADSLRRLETAPPDRIRALRAGGHAFAAAHTREAEAARLVGRWATWWPDLAWDD